MRWKPLSLIVLILSVYLAGIVIADTITGRASSQPTNISIAVVSSVPILELLSPLNGTYLINESLYLDYTQSYAETVWYNLDNSNNITLTGFIYFNTTEGPHTLYLFANNSDNDITNITRAFYINTTRLTLVYDEEKGATRGNSTDFVRYTLEQLQNLDNVVLENTLYGKISFLESINVTDDPDPEDNTINLDLYTNISYNRIEINTSSNALKNFNKSAIIKIYDLNFTNPRVIKDNETCPSSVCTFISYSAGILTFSVTGFSVYSAEESPPPEPVTPTVKFRGAAPSYNLGIDKEELSISLVPGESKVETLTITNPSSNIVPIEISVESIDEFLTIVPSSIQLGGGQKNTFNIEFRANDDVEPGIYMGYIIITSGSTIEKVLVAIEVESVEKLIEVEIPLGPTVKIAKEKLIVYPGESLFFDVNLINLEEGKADVLVEYFIKDPYQNNLVYENETITVENSIKFIKELALPKTAPTGKYLLYVKTTYKDTVSSDSIFFEIKRKMPLWLYLILILVIIVVIIAIKRKRERDKYLEAGLSGWKR